MAKAASGTKSAAIQDYLAANKAANPKQIVEALHQKGIEVSFGLASAVKYGKGKKSAAKKGRRATAAKGQPAVSGSESIRQFIAKHPSATVKEIEKGLKGEGVKVSHSLVSAVKYKKGRKVGKKKRTMARTVRVAARRTSAAITVEQLIEVKKFADSVGGVDQVRTALDTLEQLQ
jgi:arginine repressor